MKILLLQSKPFLPIKDGGNEASRALCEALLKADYEVQCLTFCSEKHPFEPKLFAQTPWDKLDIDTVKIDLSVKPVAALRALSAGISYNLSRFTDPKWLKKIKEKGKQDFDIVLCDSLYAANEIEFIQSTFPKAKLVLRAHNVEHSIWKEQANNEKALLKKNYLKSIARQLMNREIEILNYFDLVLAISQVDLDIFKIISSAKIDLLPYFPPVNEIQSTLGSDYFFIGSMNWAPNIEAHRELSTYLFPQILRSLPHAKLYFAGGNQEEINKSQAEQIIYTGFVDDKDTFMAEHGILLAPIYSGSGVRIKILEALAHGVPVVTTVKGAEGIPFANRNGILIAENDHEFIEYATEISKNETFRQEISSQAKKNMDEWRLTYDLKTIFENHVC